MKKRVLAFIFMTICFIVTEASGLGIVLMWHSKLFIPVYVWGQYIVSNQIVRYIVYGVLGIVCIAGFIGMLYYFDKLMAKPKRRRRKNK
mgnify:CR=1 FL=1